MKILEVNKEQYLESTTLLNKAKEGLDLSDFVNQRPDAYIENNIGHVFVWGMLMNNAAPIDKKLGATDYKDIIHDLEETVEKGAVAIVLHCNSGGGTCNGAFEAADAVSSCPVPVVAAIDGTCASACYKLACGADWIISNPSSVSGSIGTILIVEDTSAMLANFGISYDCFTGEENIFKSTGHLPSLTEEQKQFLADSINEASTGFKEWVLQNRPNINQEVFKSGFYSGNKALALGLVDEIGNSGLAITRAIELSELQKESDPSFDTLTDIEQ